MSDGQKCIMKIIWVVFVIWIACPCFFFIEGWIRPALVPYEIYKQTNGNMSGKTLLFFILSIIPCYFIFAFVYGFWAIIQLIIDLLPYCQSGCCDPLVDSPFPKNVMPILWADKDKHPVYKIIMDFYGNCAMGAPLNRI